MADGNIDEVVRKINKEKGVKGFIIINSEGIPIKDSFDEMEPKMLTIHYAALITSLVAKARTAVRDLDATNELTFLRLRSRKHEILVAPDKNEYSPTGLIHALLIVFLMDGLPGGGDSGGTTTGNEPLEELITLPQLQTLKTSFDSHSTGCFTPSEFRKALKPILPKSVPDGDLNSWFKRIDVIGTGGLTWDDFSGYLVHRNHRKVVQEDSRYEYQKQALDSRRRVEDHHRDMTTCTLVSSHTGKIYTCGRDGIIKQWNQLTLRHERILHNANTWITSASLLRDGTRLMVASVDRQLNLFDLTNGNLLCTYAGRKHASQRKEKHQRRHLSDTSKFGIKVDFPRQPQTSVDSSTTIDQFAGLMSKTIKGQERSLYDVAITPLCDLSSTPTSLCTLENQQGRELAALGLSDGFLHIYPLEPNKSGMCDHVCRYPLHSASVSKLQYSSYLNGIISSSWDGSLRIYNIGKQAVAQTFVGGQGPTASSSSQKAVFSFDWSEELQILASCGSERKVYIWNPFLSQPVFRIVGLQQPLVGVCLNGQHGQVLTFSQDKCIKVWDIRTFRCIQTLHDNGNYHPENSITSVCFDSTRNTIITSTTFPVAWPLSRVSTNFAPTYTGHTMPLVNVLFNTRLRQVLTCDRQQVVTWDIDEGKKLYYFKASKQLPQSHQRFGQIISRATADVRGTRLITGTDKGSVVIWNLQNCQVCAVGENKDEPTECTALLHSQRKDSWYIFSAAGSSMSIFEDSDDVHQMRSAGRYSTSSLGNTYPLPVISSLALANPSLLVIGLDVGVIVLYSPDICRKCGFLQKSDNTSSVEVLIPISTTMLASAQADGVVTIWDVACRSAVHRFNAVRDRDCTLTSMALTSDSNLYVVGDSDGCITVWGDPKKHRPPSPILSQSESTILPKCDNQNKYSNPFEIDNCDSSDVTTEPQFIRLYQAHSEGVSSIATTTHNGTECIITAGHDCLVKLYTTEGISIGSLGVLEQGKWKLSDPDTWVRTSTKLHRKSTITKTRSKVRIDKIFQPSLASLIPSVDPTKHEEPTVIAPSSIPTTDSGRLDKCSIFKRISYNQPQHKVLSAISPCIQISPERHIRLRNFNKFRSNFVRSSRSKGFVSTTAGIAVLICTAALHLMDLSKSRLTMRSLSLGKCATFITETEINDDTRPHTARVPVGESELMRQRIEIRLTKQGIPLTARGDFIPSDLHPDGKQWEAKGADVLRRIRRHKTRNVDDNNKWTAKYSGTLRACVREVVRIAKPGAPHPPQNWKPSNCGLCALEKQSISKRGVRNATSHACASNPNIVTEENASDTVDDISVLADAT